LGQTMALAIDGTVALLVKAVCDQWPGQARDSSPCKWLTISSLLSLSAAAVLLYTAYWLSGTGWRPPKKKACFDAHVVEPILVVHRESNTFEYPAQSQCTTTLKRMISKLCMRTQT